MDTPIEIRSEEHRFCIRPSGHPGITITPTIQGNGRHGVTVRMRSEDGMGLVAFIDEDEWAELLFSPCARDAMASLAIKLCKKAGYRVQRRKLGIWYDTWETI